MKHADFWMNFRMGEETAIAGTFIYNGIRQFHEMRHLDNGEDLFEFLYNLSVGFERLLKVAVVLCEFQDGSSQSDFEASLITHNHLDLIARVRKHSELKLGPIHNEFMALLSRFYKSLRYDRFSLSSIYDPEKEREAVRVLFNKHLNVEIPNDRSIFGTTNTDQYRRFVRRLCIKIASELYSAISDHARARNLYTYELRSGSKAETVFLGAADVEAEDVLWKELLIFLMNTKSQSGYLDFLRSIEPLEFDPELVGDYLDCFRSDVAKAMVIGEVETLYEDLVNKGERLQLMEIIGNPGVDFSTSDEDLEEEGPEQ